MNPYLKLLRIKGWYAYLCFAIFGFVIAQGFLGQLVDVLVFFGMIFTYLGFSFAINDSFDVQEDLLNDTRSNPIATAEIEQKNAIRFSLALGIAGLLLSTWFGLMIFFYQLTLTVLSYLYSAPPLRLKSRYPFDILSHGFFFGALILLLPVIVFGPITNIAVLLTFSVFFLSILIELWNHISDYESDMKAMLKTTVCVLGLEKSVKIAIVLSLLFPVTLFPLYYGKGYMLRFVFATTVYSLLIYWKKSPTFLFSYANLLYGHIMVLVSLPLLI